MFQVLRDGTRTQHSVPLYWILNVLNVFIWTIFFHPQILRNLHPWIHPCVLACWHLSVIHELQWVQKWPFDLRVSICSLHLRLWSGSVWINFPMSLCLLGSCIYLSYVTGFGFKQNILSCFSAMPHTQPYNCASRFIKQIISSSTSKELLKMPQQLPHSPKLISPLCYSITGVFQLRRDH